MSGECCRFGQLSVSFPLRPPVSACDRRLVCQIVCQAQTLTYGCAWFHERGWTVCRNGATLPMADADDRLIEALLEDVLDPTMLTDAVDEALHVLQGDASDDRPARLEAELVTVERERARLVSAKYGTLPACVPGWSQPAAVRAASRIPRGPWPPR